MALPIAFDPSFAGALDARTTGLLSERTAKYGGTEYEGAHFYATDDGQEYVYRSGAWVLTAVQNAAIEQALVTSSVAAKVVSAADLPPGMELYVSQLANPYALLFGPSSSYAAGNPGAVWLGFDSLFDGKLAPAAVFNCPGVAFWWAILSKIASITEIIVPDNLASHTGGTVNANVMAAFGILGEILQTELLLGMDHRDSSTVDPSGTGAPSAATIAAVSPVS